ncbi:MAG TPA: hypothetical protein VFV47_09795, partial [Hyphomicrobiaceae bacterium]|nr:hypothetical protein [Hyphomicrobiaceae bacterium]
MHLPPATLQGALAAVVCRDIRGTPLSDAQRLTHFPASPLLCISCFQEFDVGFVDREGGSAEWRPFESPLMVSGSQSAPAVSWAPGPGRGVIVVFTVAVAHALFGLDARTLQDRFVAAHEVLDGSWWPLLDALRSAPDDEASLRALEQHIAPRWQALQGAQAPGAALRRIGRHWLEHLAWQATQWRRTHGPRQVERRVKAMSGRSLREWGSLVRTEGLFFAARERHESGLPFDWAGLAQEEGFADQAHLVRATK